MSDPTQVKRTKLRADVTPVAVGLVRFNQIQEREAQRKDLQRKLEFIQSRARFHRNQGDYKHARLLEVGLYSAIAGAGFTVLNGQVI